MIKTYNKKLSGILAFIMMAGCMALYFANVAMAENNWRDTTWYFSNSQPTASYSTEYRDKRDSSKVYVLNDSVSNGPINVSIIAKYNNAEYDCTYNTGEDAIIITYPYRVLAGRYKYCSSTVYERFGYGTLTKLNITVTPGGTYSGVWSPDNKNGY